MNGRAQARDLILPLMVVAVVGMMIFPLPSAVLDALLMCNISFALALLVSSVYLSRPERFTSLPSILLLCTLFRLGLNISTTRQILASGTAPDVIVTFGTFVVRGNPVVGIVVFAIITLVQFLVIAKGAERVAEVAARFTLDAMPGKQMSIDADVRSGILSLLEAKEKRLDLQRESKLYGALDGAMKFVKGDAIAGLLITVINIAAGFIVGITQQGLTFSAAAEKYTLFTIGDGLVSQIPALLVAVAAGIAVTRVEDKESRFVGRDMLDQLSQEPQALATTSGVLALLACVPGLPMLPYLAMASVFGIGAYRLRKRLERNERINEDRDFHPKLFSGVVLRISVEGTLLLQEEKALPNYIQSLRSEIFELRGVIVPDVQFDIDRTLSDKAATIHLHGVEMVKVVRQDSPTEAGTSRGESANFSREIINALRSFLIDHLAELVDDTQTRMLLEAHQRTAEDLINSVIPEMIGVTGLTALLRQLIVEEVSIRSMNTILQSIAEYHVSSDRALGGGSRIASIRNAMLPALKALNDQEQQFDTKGIELLAVVRIGLRRAITKEVADSSWCIDAWVLDVEWDNLLAKVAFAGIPLEPGAISEIISAVHDTEDKPNDRGSRVILTSIFSRKFFAELLQHECSGVRVLAVSELSDEAQVRVLGTIGGKGAERVVEQVPESTQEENCLEQDATSGKRSVEKIAA